MKNLSIEWIIGQIWKYKLTFILGLGLGLGISLGVYKTLPKQYKTIGKINVSPKYFQNPMMMDFLPTVYDSSEMRSEREAAISGALSEEFLMKILIQENPSIMQMKPIERDAQLAKLRASFEVLRENTSVFQIGAKANNLEKSYDLCVALMNEIIITARNSRAQYLEHLRDAVKNRLQSLSGASMTSASVNEIKNQITEMERQKRLLSASYNANHPDLVAIDNRIKTLQKMITGGTENRVYTANTIDPTQKASTDVKERLQEDLMKKYQNLEIVIDLESKENNSYINVVSAPLHSRSPVSPQISLFIAFGFLIGLFLGIGAVAFRSREEIRAEFDKNNTLYDPVTGKKRDRRNPHNRNNDYVPMDQ